MSIKMSSTEFRSLINLGKCRWLCWDGHVVRIHCICLGIGYRQTLLASFSLVFTFNFIYNDENNLKTALNVQLIIKKCSHTDVWSCVNPFLKKKPKMYLVLLIWVYRVTEEKVRTPHKPISSVLPCGWCNYRRWRYSTDFFSPIAF